MKTVLIDNSLCALSIKDNAEASDISRYIMALAQTGVKYVELDFRALMKIRRLPEGIGYIFRPVDPMFMRFTEVFRFDYVALSVSEITKYSKLNDLNTGTPVLLSLPLPGGDFMTRSPREIIQCAEGVIRSKVTSVRFRGDFPLLSAADAEKYISFLRRRVAVPVDICPTNGCRTALNTALNFINCNTDSVTVTMGSPDKYCSLEELMITFLTMFGGCPEELSMAGLCKAAALHTQVFNSSLASDIPNLVNVFENDFLFLQNADTGERVFTGNFPRKQRRFSQSFAEFLKGIKSDWSIRDCEPFMEEAAGSYSAALYNDLNNDDDNKRSPFGKNPPFLN